MELVVLKTKVKTPEDVWAEDRSLLADALNLGLGRALPTNEEAKQIILARQKRWLDPPEPFELNTSSLEDILNKLVPELESLWEAKLSMPCIEILPAEAYLPRMQELDKITIKKFGYGAVIQSPPTMFNAPDHKKILIPKKYLLRNPKGRDTSVLSSDFTIEELEWDKPFLEEVLAGNLSYALFRQLRGEWGEGFIDAMKKLGRVYEGRINDINQAIGQYAKEKLAKNRGAAWRLYVVGEKIGVAWQSREGMQNYVVIDALSKTKSLAQIAMVDELSVLTNGRGVVAEFHVSHPNHEYKRQKFDSEKQ